MKFLKYFMCFLIYPFLILSEKTTLKNHAKKSNPIKPQGSTHDSRAIVYKYVYKSDLKND